MNAEPKGKVVVKKLRLDAIFLNVLITGVQVKPRNQAVHIETIDFSYVLTRYDNKSLKS